MEKPLIMTRPAVGRISPVRSLMMVDLPEPDGPTRNTNSPSSMVKEMPVQGLRPVVVCLFNVLQSNHISKNLFRFRKTQ